MISAGSLFQNVVNNTMNQACRFGFRQFVINFLAGSAVGQQTGLSQSAEVMRYGGGTHSDGQRNVVDTLFAVRKQP